jgi:hypothetical protein
MFTKRHSKRHDKKWAVTVPSPAGPVVVDYGAKGYSDFTLNHDPERRESYRSRHQHDLIDDPYKPGFWSWYHLWGASSNSDKAFHDAVKRAKQILKF